MSHRFLTAYIECALWSSMDNTDDTGGLPLDRNYDIGDIDNETLAKMEADCRDFVAKALALGLPDDPRDLELAGRDFWLTRNGHGAGFWDGDWSDPLGDRLTTLSKSYGEFDLYVGDDNKIHGG